jgi:hypothetical protein
MLILFDQGTPVNIRPFLEGHTIRTAAQQGWSTLTNSTLLDVAEAVGFELLLTTDKSLTYQQNLRNRRIAIVVISNAQWPILREHVKAVVEAVNAATPGSYFMVDIPLD